MKMKPSEVFEKYGIANSNYGVDKHGNQIARSSPRCMNACVWDAIKIVYEDEWNIWDLMMDAQDKLQAYLHANYGTWDIAAWNDDPERTLEDIISALKAVGE
jgi:hypothetical protein